MNGNSKSLVQTACLTAATIVAGAGPVLAQLAPAAPTGMGSTEMLSGGGWDLFRNLAELQAFAVDVAVTAFLAALIVFHPVRVRSRRTLSDLMMPRLFFLYAFIGMTIGFLVINHGYVIGFVVFGIGALLRFRSNMDDPVDTVEIIMVTLLGLSVGLNLPVMAILITAVCWLFIWGSGRRTGIEITLKSSDEDQLIAAIQNLRGMAERMGWKLVHAHHVTGKSGASLLFRASGNMPEDDIQAGIASELPEGVDARIKI